MSERFETRGAGGIRIAGDRHGDPDAPGVVFLHGGGQTRRSWSRVAAAVARRGWQAVTIDLRGQMSDLVSQENAARLLSRFPQIEFVDIRGAGHMVAGDRNDILADAVLDFLARQIRR